MYKLLDDNINVSVIRLLVFWYSNQQACIRWHDKISPFFTLGNGTRQGGVLSGTLKMRDMKMLHQNTRHENARNENTGKKNSRYENALTY